MAGEPAASSAAATIVVPPQFRIVGILLAVFSGLLIGSSFVFKKKGLLASQGDNLGEGVAYLKSAMWWFGMTLMILGEICNFAAYAFVEAIVVTPLGALSVVVCAILSHFFLKESLTFFGIIGCALCILGSVVIALNGPKDPIIGQIEQFKVLFLAPGFLTYGSLVIAISLVIIFYFGPRYGKKSMLWYIMVCSLIGGLSVTCTTGFGSALVTTVLGDNQFRFWFIYFILVFVIITLLVEIVYLNKALALYNTAMVTPVYFVIFTTCTMVSSIVLFQGLHIPVIQIITVVMGFLTICLGITLLQMSKVDPTKLTKLDRRSTLLIQASRRHTELSEKSVTGIEEPGIDAFRGGTIGSIIRARSMRRLSQATSAGSPVLRARRGLDPEQGVGSTTDLSGLTRHQLYDAPVPGENISLKPHHPYSQDSLPPRSPTIKFVKEDIAHFYPMPGTPGEAQHQSFRQGAPHPRKDTLPLPGINESYDGLPSAHTFPPSPNTGLASAPAGQAQFSPPSFADPFEDTPKTARPADFPQIPPSRQDSETSLSSSGEDNSRGTRSQRGAGRKYPQSSEDREESIGLVSHEGSGSRSNETTSVRKGGVRLLPISGPRRI